MILFLDVVSPIPEFHLIDDKKVKVSIKIIENKDEKLSDSIITKYLKMNEAYKLNKLITHFIVTSGPGSYTSLRVGASFIAGLSQSTDLPVAVISGENIYEFLKNDNANTCVYFESSNNQNFLTFRDGEKIVHKKVENKNCILPKNIKNIFYNNESPDFYDENLVFTSFSFLEIALKHLNKLEFKKNTIIKPIYISNNVILN